MRRSEALVVAVLCPHFERPVRAVRNAANERLVDCDSKHDCVAPAANGERPSYPIGCPVFRSGE